MNEIVTQNPIKISKDMADKLSPADLEQAVNVLNGYRDFLTQGKRLTPFFLHRSLSTIQTFITFCGKTPNLLTRSDLVEWEEHLAKSCLCISTVRSYGVTTKNFMHYIEERGIPGNTE